MFEISLVPDVKGQLLQKQKIRNLIIFICLIVAAACGGVILIMLSVTGTQALTIGGQEKEISCRADGSLPKGASGSCSEYGTPVMTFENVDELLTIQDQMNKISILNNNKIKFSRIFGLLDVLLPNTDEDIVQINELSTDVSQNTLSFDAVGYATNQLGFHALETFKKSAEKTYFDYGSYMRKDPETDEYVVIPSFCITEKIENGYIYGEYHKGNPGCEAPMVEKKDDDQEEKESEEKLEEESTEEPTDVSEEPTGDTEENPEEEEKKKVEKETITIRRTYDNSDDKEAYKNGNDPKATNKKVKNSGYYFESACIQYDEKGEFDENATLETCPVLAEDGLTIGDSSYGRDADDKMVLSFSAVVVIDARIFKASNRYMRIIGPSRQNVTDSYVQIRDMFTARAKDEVKEGEQ